MAAHNEEVMFSMRIGADGNVTMIYKDGDVPFMEQLGVIDDVDRASHVEWSEGGWTVTSAHDTTIALRYDDDGNVVAARSGELARFTERAEALRHEVAAFWNLNPITATL